MHEMKHDNVKR